MASFIPHSIYLRHLAQAMHGLLVLYPSHAVALGTGTSMINPSTSKTGYSEARAECFRQIFGVYNGKGSVSDPIANDQIAPVVSEIVFAGSTQSLPNAGQSSMQIILGPGDLASNVCLSPLELSPDPIQPAFAQRTALAGNIKSFRRLYLFFDVHTVDTDSNDVVLCRDLPMGLLSLDSDVSLTKSSPTLYEGGTTFCASVLIDLGAGTGSVNIGAASEINNTSIYSQIIRDLADIYSSARSLTDNKLSDLSLLKSKFTQLLHQA